MRTPPAFRTLPFVQLGLGLLTATVQASRPNEKIDLPAADNAPVRGADELHWVPTLEQAMEMAQATGRPIFLMGYSLVGDGSTYTRVADEYCTGVY